MSTLFRIMKSMENIVLKEDFKAPCHMGNWPKLAKIGQNGQNCTKLPKVA